MSLLSKAEQQKAAEASESGIAPAGAYLCHVSVVEKWNTGTSLLWKFRVAKGQPFAGHEFWDWTGLSDAGIWKTKARLMELGVPLDAEVEDIVGTPCQVFVEVKTIDSGERKGEPKNKVARVVRYTGDLEADDQPSLDDDIDAAFGSEDDDLI